MARIFYWKDSEGIPEKRGILGLGIWRLAVHGRFRQLPMLEVGPASE
jgi:hypothetical protein